jgi:uncharacterized membrane protein
MQNPPPGQIEKSSTGLDANLAALLSYVFGWVSGLVFFLIEKESRLVRFHAMQSILLNIVIAVVSILLWIVSFVFIFIGMQLPDIMGSLMWLVATLVWLVFCVGLLIAWVMCLIRAYQNQYFKLPLIGNMAEKFANK